MTTLLDFSFQHPTPAQIKACGAVGVLRYLTRSSSAKRLTAAEAKSYRDAGLRVGVVFEDTAGRALTGQQAGRDDAVFAAQQARSVGIPTSCPIFFAVDVDTTAAKVRGYFDGIRQAKISHPIGVYGSFQVVEGIMRAGLAGYGWQTVAWSHGQLSPLAHLFQHASGLLPGTDTNDLLRPVPLWGAPAIVVKPEAVVPPTPLTPAPPSPDQEDTMRIVYVNGSTPLLISGDGRVAQLSNPDVESLRAWGIPVHPVTKAQLDGGLAALQRLS